MRVELSRTGRFVITVDPRQSGVARRIPGARWYSAKRVWVVPPSRLARDLMRASIPEEAFTPDALAAVNRPTAIARGAPIRADYPTRIEPFKHQRGATAHLYQLPVGALHMQPGTGKTKATIDTICEEVRNHEVNAVLVACPLSVRRTWLSELAAHMTVVYSPLLLDTGKQAAYKRWLDNLDRVPVLIVGVESFATGRAFGMAEQFVQRAAKTAMIVDEAHLIKNHAANRTRACWSLGKHCVRRYELTGTPTANSLVDLYAQFEFLDPDIIGCGDYYTFRDRYCVMGGYEGKQIVGYQNTDELMAAIAPYVFRANKADCLDLPPKLYEKRYVQLTTEQRKHYDTAKRAKLITTATGSLSIKSALEKALRLSQITSGIIPTEDPVQPGVYHYEETPSPKIDELLVIADSTDESMIVWCAYRNEVDRVVQALRARYGDEQVVQIHGGITEADRHAAVEAMQSKRARFLVGTAATGGVGITVTAATVVVYLSNTFKYVDRVQSEDRAHRAGQTNKVTVIDVIAEGTVDEDVVAALTAKQDLADWLSISLDGVSTSMVQSMVYSGA